MKIHVASAKHPSTHSGFIVWDGNVGRVCSDDDTENESDTDCAVIP